MVRKKKLGEILSLLIALLILFHLFYANQVGITYAGTEMEENSSPMLATRRDYHKQEITSLNAKYWPSNLLDFVFIQVYERITEHSYILNDSKNNYFYYQKIPDFRSEVKKAVHHQFHGSKYKEGLSILI